MSAQTTLIIADDHPLFRAALHQAIERLLPDAHVVEAGSIAALEEAANEHPLADLILLDLRMPGAQGLSELMELRIRHPAIPVAVISAVESATVARKTIACGGSGFIPKSASRRSGGCCVRFSPAKSSCRKESKGRHRRRQPSASSRGQSRR